MYKYHSINVCVTKHNSSTTTFATPQRIQAKLFSQLASNSTRYSLLTCNGRVDKQTTGNTLSDIKKRVDWVECILYF